MAEIPRPDWDLIHRWEWFRREQWLPAMSVSASPEEEATCEAFARTAQIAQAKVLLDSACGLGRRVIALTRRGLNILGSDISAVAIDGAQRLAASAGISATFFVSSWQETAQRAPHRFDGILCSALSLIPAWEELCAAMAGLFQALRPGGFLMFSGAGSDTPPDEGKRRLSAEWDMHPHQQAEWLWREGDCTCGKMLFKHRGADYIDCEYIYLIAEKGGVWLESTTLRRPFYWTWKHFLDASRRAGFCHVETRVFDQADGKAAFNVAWRSREGEAKIDEAGRNAPYAL